MIDVAEPMAAGVDRFPTRAQRVPERLDTLSREILELKKKLNAVILAHNYQVPEIQDVADYVGDSLGLAQQAARTNADVIVFCGVHFMAETAKILNPTKTVILPDKDAGCSLEASCPPERLRALQATNPNFYTIAYINCSAEVKALSDVICTSGNAVKIVNAAPNGFNLRHVIEAPNVAAPVAWAALSDIAKWWDPEHTYSGDARNLSLDPVVRGCFCEKFSLYAGIEHGRVVYAQPAKTLRVIGALGPLQEFGVTGAPLAFQASITTDWPARTYMERPDCRMWSPLSSGVLPCGPSTVAHTRPWATRRMPSVLGRSVTARPRASFQVPGSAMAGAEARRAAQVLMGFSSDGFSE
jgi:hypothetical protein